MNVSDLQVVLGLSYSTNNSTLSENKEIDYNLHGMLVKSYMSHMPQQCGRYKVVALLVF